MRYVIMANGQGKRWANHKGTTKHLVEVEGESLLKRTTRLILEREPDGEVIISSSNSSYSITGARRHSPNRDTYELDRFCYELIDGQLCFLYGDVFYTSEAIDLITSTRSDGLLFFGSEKSIYAVKVFDDECMRRCLNSLFADIESGALQDAKGWHVYHRYLNMPLEGHEVGERYILIDDSTTDFNTPRDLDVFLSKRQLNDLHVLNAC